jgi:hypothetical protein
MTQKDIVKEKKDALKSIPRELRYIIVETKSTKVKENSSDILIKMRYCSDSK